MMTPLRQKIAESRFKSVRNLARHLNINNSNLFNFLAARYHKVGKNTRLLIRDFFRSEGWLPTPVPRPKHECPVCHKVHVIAKPKVTV